MKQLIHIPCFRYTKLFSGGCEEITNNDLFQHKKSKKIRYGRYNYVWSADRFDVKIQGMPGFSTCNDHPENTTWKHLDRLPLWKLPKGVKECWVEIK